MTSQAASQYTKSTPPGCQEGISRYPFRPYSQTLKLWTPFTYLTDTQIGPAIAGRLKGRLFYLAMVEFGGKAPCSSLQQEYFLHYPVALCAGLSI